MVDKLWLIQQIINYKDPHHEEEDPQNDIEPEQIRKFIKQYEKESLEAYNQMTKETIEHNMRAIMDEIENTIIERGDQPRYWLIYRDAVKAPELIQGRQTELETIIGNDSDVTYLMDFSTIQEFKNKKQNALEYIIDQKIARGDTH